MDVTPQLLHDVEFREAKRGGYNTQDVDDFLERLAVGLERQEALVREARQRIEAAESRVAEAEHRAAQAEQRASSTSDADETLKRTLVLAQRTADAAIREAEEEAARTLGSAQEEAARLLAEAREASTRARAEAEDEARRAHEDARNQVLAEMHELESGRDQLRGDVEALEAHLAHQRDRLRTSAEHLQHLLDDPDALAEVPLPSISDVQVPAPEAPAERPAARPPLVAETVYEDELDEGGAWESDEESWGEPDPGQAPPVEDRFDDRGPGPATQPVETLPEPHEDDDAYLRELRKAMTDESPLGPRDELGHDELFDGGTDSPRSRFGRRR
jgi:DivIVA domain-containing protein